MEGLSNNIRDRGVVKDLRFLEDWEQGSVPWSRAASVVIRVRQLRRANPELEMLKKAITASER